MSVMLQGIPYVLKDSPRLSSADGAGKKVSCALILLEVVINDLFPELLGGYEKFKKLPERKRFRAKPVSGLPGD
ncbi:hypothetical protein TNCV_4049401 [Trichonephila clavipes]|nr:hypothetical protein TNCV_4049401 [Trichonephila clavipes]